MDLHADAGARTRARMDARARMDTRKCMSMQIHMLHTHLGSAHAQQQWGATAGAGAAVGQSLPASCA